MDSNNQNVQILQQMHHLDPQMEAHIITDQLSHSSVNQMNLPSISQLNHAQMMECTTNESPNQMVDHLNTNLHMTQITLPQQINGAMVHIIDNVSIKVPTQEAPLSSNMISINERKVVPSVPDPELTCKICHITYESKKFLNYHYTSTHKEQKKNIKCAYMLQNGCNEMFRTRKDYEEHLVTDHNCLLDVKNYTFGDAAHFDQWKQQMEESTTSQFILKRGCNRYKNGLLLRSYRCSRSGEKTRPTGKRPRKICDKSIMGAECPAHIKAVTDRDGKVEVTYVATHIGHNVDSIPRSTHQMAKKRYAAKQSDIFVYLNKHNFKYNFRIAIKRMKLEEKNKSFNSSSIRTERLLTQRNDIIEELNCIDLTSEGFKSDRIEKLLSMIRIALDLFKDDDRSSDKRTLPQQNGSEMVDASRLVMEGDSVHDILNEMY